MDIQELPNTPNDTTGYIYIIYNEMYKHYRDDIYKIGKANDIKKRLTGYITGYIEPVFLVYGSDLCTNYSVVEKEVHIRLSKFRIKPNREFFKIHQDIAIKVIKDVVLELNLLTKDEILKYHDTKIIKINKIKKKEMQTLTENIRSELFDEYLFNDDKYNAKYVNINTNIEAVGLCKDDNELLIEYKDVLIDKFKINDHFNVIRCLKTDEYIDMKIAEQKDKNFNVKIFDSNYNKIKLLRQLEDDNGFEKFVFHDVIDDMKPIIINNFELIKKVFNVAKKPMTYTELIKMRVTLYKHLMGTESIITSRISKNNI